MVTIKKNTKVDTKMIKIIKVYFTKTSIISQKKIEREKGKNKIIIKQTKQ